MPITSIGSYITTTEEFAINWDQANIEMGDEPLTLAGGYTLNQFEDEREDAVRAINLVSDKATQARFAAAVRDTRKIELSTRHKQLRGFVAAKITNAAYARELPPVPRPSADESKFITPLLEAADVWRRVNEDASSLGLDGPVTLAEGYTLEQFEADIAALRGAYDAATKADTATGFARTRRDNLLNALYDRMKQYRQLVPSVLPKNSPARENLPRLSPAPGTTPPPVVVQGHWDAALGKAILVWEKSNARDLAKLQVRGCTGPYKNAEEEIIASNLSTDATRYETDWGLTVPGSNASFKVYVMTTTGNENGGKAVRIVRPES